MNKVQLSQICEVKKGQTITKKTITEGNIPVIAGGQQPAYYHNEPNRTGDVITVSGSGAYAGFVNFFTEPIFASDCTTIQSLDENKALTRYVFYLLKGLQEYIYSMQRGAGQPHVYPKDLVGIEIPLAPLPVQQQIVSILEKAENLKLKRNETNKETQKIIQSLFYEMFGDPVKNEKGWDVKRLVQVLKEDKYIVGGPFGSNLKVVDYKEKGIPIMRLQNIQKRTFIDKNIIFISEKKAEELKYHSFQSGDIILAKLGDELGKSCIVPDKYSYGIVVGDVIRIRVPENTINKTYLLNVLNADFCAKLLGGQKTGTTRPRVNLSDIRNIPVSVPPLPLQEEFAKKVQLIESIQSKQQSSTDDINTLFDALMQKAFKGELVE